MNRLHRLIGMLLGVVSATPWSSASAGKWLCEKYALDIVASGARPDREVAAQLTAAALIQLSRGAAVTVAGSRSPELPEGTCLAHVTVAVARTGSDVGVDLRIDVPGKARHGTGVGADVVLALESALVAAGQRDPGAVPLVALLPPPTCEATRNPSVRALVVGIERYGDSLDRVNGAVRDASLVQAAILARYPAASVTKLVDGAADERGLRAALTALVEASGCGDLVFIHYSGHATRVVPVPGGEMAHPSDVGRLALVSSDRRSITERALRGFVTALRNRRAFVIVGLDATNTDGASLGASWRRSAMVEDVDLLRGAGALGVIAAGDSPYELAFPEGQAAGPLSLSLSLALKSEGEMTLRTLAAAIAQNVERLTTFAARPFFEASDPDALLLPGSARAPASLEVRLDGQKEVRGVTMLALSPALEGQKLTIAGYVSSAERLTVLFVNGTLAELEPGGRFRVTLELRPGTHNVQFVGVLPDLSLAATSREVQVGAEAGRSLGNGYAVLIGIERYDKWGPLVTPLADVREVARILRERYGFVTTLPSYGNLVLENPDRYTIGSAFAALRTALGPDDRLVIYYAGHGRAEGTSERRRGFWIPRDADPANRATWYSGQELLGEIVDMRARHVLVVSDSCFSGDLTRDEPTPAAEQSEAERRARFDERSARPSRILITSGFDEPVLDQGGGGHSVFARAFIDGLAKMPDERFLSFELFSRFIYEQVGGKSKQQPHHVFLVDSGHGGGDMPFVGRGPTDAKATSASKPPKRK